MDILETNISKSTVDSETVSMTEGETESEIEEDDFLNRDDEPVPEYDVEDEERS